MDSPFNVAIPVAPSPEGRARRNSNVFRRKAHAVTIACSMAVAAKPNLPAHGATPSSSLILRKAVYREARSHLEQELKAEGEEQRHTLDAQSLAVAIHTATRNTMRRHKSVLQWTDYVAELQRRKAEGPESWMGMEGHLLALDEVLELLQRQSVASLECSAFSEMTAAQQALMGILSVCSNAGPSFKKLLESSRLSLSKLDELAALISIDAARASVIAKQFHMEIILARQQLLEDGNQKDLVQANRFVLEDLERSVTVLVDALDLSATPTGADRQLETTVDVDLSLSSQLTSPRHIITPPPLMTCSASLTRPQPLRLNTIDSVEQQCGIESSEESDCSTTCVTALETDSEGGCLDTRDSVDCESDLESLRSDSASVDSAPVRQRRFAVGLPLAEQRPAPLWAKRAAVSPLLLCDPSNVSSERLSAAGSRGHAPKRNGHRSPSPSVQHFTRFDDVCLLQLQKSSPRVLISKTERSQSLTSPLCSARFSRFECVSPLRAPKQSPRSSTSQVDPSQSPSPRPRNEAMLSASAEPVAAERNIAPSVASELSSPGRHHSLCLNALPPIHQQCHSCDGYPSSARHSSTTPASPRKTSRASICSSSDSTTPASSRKTSRVSICSSSDSTTHASSRKTSRVSMCSNSDSTTPASSRKTSRVSICSSGDSTTPASSRKTSRVSICNRSDDNLAHLPAVADQSNVIANYDVRKPSSRRQPSSPRPTVFYMVPPRDNHVEHALDVVPLTR